MKIVSLSFKGFLFNPSSHINTKEIQNRIIPDNLNVIVPNQNKIKGSDLF